MSGMTYIIINIIKLLIFYYVSVPENIHRNKARYFHGNTVQEKYRWDDKEERRHCYCQSHVTVTETES